jgi:deoxyadenosine/deoxycytidine kinase
MVHWRTRRQPENAPQLKNIKNILIYGYLTLFNPRMEKKDFTVLVEGNIGSGKSHFIDLLQGTPKIKTFNEPLNEWENFHGVNLFAKYYNQPKKYSGIFQQYVFQTQWKQFRDNTTNIKIIERSPYSA